MNLQQLIQQSEALMTGAPDWSDLRTKVDKLRKARGWSQNEFADTMQLSRSFVSEFITGKKGIAPHTAAWLNVRIASIMKQPKNALNFSNTGNKGAKIEHLQEKGRELTELQTPSVPLAQHIALRNPQRRQHL